MLKEPGPPRQLKKEETPCVGVGGWGGRGAGEEDKGSRQSYRHASLFL